MRPRARSAGGPAHHLDARETRRARERAERLDRRHVPVAEVGVELTAGVQLEQAAPAFPGTCAATVSITATSRVTARSRSRHVSGSFMWYSTPRYSTMSNVPSVARSTVVKSATTGSTRLSSTRCARSKPRRPGRSARQKSVVSRDWSGSTPRARHSFQYSRARREVDAPGVVIERDDARRAPPLGEERVVAVPRADIEHRCARGSRGAAPRSPSRPSPTGPW